jgi:hypothetical protein
MNDPFWRLPVVPSFTVTSTDVTDGQALPPAQMSGIFGVPGGEDISPQLSWSGAPAETKSYTVTMYDPDAPSGSGLGTGPSPISPLRDRLPTGAGDGHCSRCEQRPGHGGLPAVPPDAGGQERGRGGVRQWMHGPHRRAGGAGWSATCTMGSSSGS